MEVDAVGDAQARREPFQRRPLRAVADDRVAQSRVAAGRAPRARAGRRRGACGPPDVRPSRAPAGPPGARRSLAPPEGSCRDARPASRVPRLRRARSAIPRLFASTSLRGPEARGDSRSAGLVASGRVQHIAAVDGDHQRRPRARPARRVSRPGRRCARGSARTGTCARSRRSASASGRAPTRPSWRTSDPGGGET